MSEAGRGPRFVKVLWQAVRFILFGVGGFILTIGSLIIFIEDVAPSGHFTLAVLWTALGFIAGAFMTLYGVGEWGRWAYLWVFASIPLALLTGFLFPTSKEAGFFFPLAAAVLSLTLVRRYYRRKTVSTN